MADNRDDRLMEIETRLAYQENTLLALDDVIARQQKQIDQLEISVRLLVERLQQVLEALEPSRAAIDEKPPHY